MCIYAYSKQITSSTKGKIRQLLLYDMDAYVPTYYVYKIYILILVHALVLYIFY